MKLRDAVKLYEVLEPFLPEDIEEDEIILSYAEKIIRKIYQGNPMVFYTAIEIMWKIPQTELLEYDDKTSLELFMRGLVEVKILELKSFMENNYGNSK
jgi:hypothetical protein